MARLRRRVASSDSPTPLWGVGLLGVFLLAGLGMLGGAGYRFVDTRHAIATAARADGTVIDLIVSHDSDDGDVYYPHVRFVTPAGESVEFTGSFGSNPAGFDVGEPVEVLYDASSPNVARINTIFQLWFVPIMLTGMGLIFGAIGAGGVVALFRPGTPPSGPMSGSPAAKTAAAGARTVERAPRD
jgi:hypothetical protein